MSGGGLKVGDLYVSVTASVGEALKGLSQLVDKVEEVADEIEENMSKAAAALGDFSDGLLTVSALAAGAFALATKTSNKAADEMEALEKSIMLLGREVGETFIPLVREMTAWVKTGIATWRGMDAGLKENLVTFVKYAAVVGVASKALERTLVFTKSFAEGTVALIRIGKMVLPTLVNFGGALVRVASLAKNAGWALTYLRQATLGQVFASMTASMSGFTSSLAALPGAVASMGKSFIGMLPAIGSAAAMLLAVAAAVAAIVLVAGVLYKRWGDLKFIIKESSAGLVEELQKLGERAAAFFEGLMMSVKSFISTVATALLEVVFARVKEIARFLEKVARTLGRDTLADNIAQVQNLSAEAFIAKLKDGAAEAGQVLADKVSSAGKKLAESTKGLREAVVYGLTDAAEGAQQLGSDLAKALRLDELMALPGKLRAAVPTLGDGSAVELPKDRKLEVGKVDTSVGLPASVRAFAQGVDPVMRAHLDMLKANAKAAADAVRAAWEAMQAAAAAIKSKLAARMGEITDILDSVAQGFAAGGTAGAAIAVIGDLLTRSEGFSTIIGMVNNLLQLVADSLGQLITPLQPLVGAIFMVAQAVVGALMPIFTVLVQAFEPFVPVLVMVSELINALAPLFQIFAGVLQLIDMPLKLLVNVGLRLLFEGVKHLSIGVLYVAKGIGDVWNGIVTAVQSVLMALGNIELFGGKPFRFLLDWGTALGDAMVDTYGLMTAIGKLHDATWETAQAQAEQAAAVLRTKNALDKATQSLTNVPASWKYALRSFEAQNVRGGAAAQPSSPPPNSPASTPSAPVAPAAQPAPAAQQVNSITINVQDEYAAMSALERKLDEMAYRSRGSRGTQYSF